MKTVFYIDGKEVFSGTNWDNNIPKVNDELLIPILNGKVARYGEYTRDLHTFVVDKVMYEVSVFAMDGKDPDTLKGNICDYTNGKYHIFLVAKKEKEEKKTRNTKKNEDSKKSSHE